MTNPEEGCTTCIGQERLLVNAECKTCQQLGAIFSGVDEGYGLECISQYDEFKNKVDPNCCKEEDGIMTYRYSYETGVAGILPGWNWCFGCEHFGKQGCRRCINIWECVECKDGWKLVEIGYKICVPDPTWKWKDYARQLGWMLSVLTTLLTLTI